MRNRGNTLRIWALSMAMVLAGLVLPAAPAGAQELIGRCQGLLECLFGGPREPPPQRNVPAQRRTTTPSVRQRAAPPVQRNRVPPRSPAGSAVTAAPPPEVEKLENARIVLVVGDFLASGLAEGLGDAYSQSPGVRIVDKTNGSSGFVRDDYYDWNANIGAILDEVRPSVVVVMIGSNDRQQIVVDGNRADPRSDQWTREYTKRVDAFATAVTSRKLPLVWTGLPSFKSPGMTSDMLAFNDLYKQQVTAAGGEFVDIWDGFVDESGNFIFTGPDMNGQPVRLRGSDGINLTRAGKRKLAFYAEKPLNKILGAAVSPDVDDAAMGRMPETATAPVEPGAMDRTQPISLLGPDLDGGSTLLGAASPDPADKSRKGRDGMAAKPPPGRADNFSLAPPRSAPRRADHTTTSAAR